MNVDRLCNPVRLVVCSLLALCFTGCGSGPSTGENGGGQGGNAAWPAVATEGVAVVKVRPANAGIVSMEEKLVSIFTEGPLRRVKAYNVKGEAVFSYGAPDGWFLLDMAPHASGDISVVLTDGKRLKLVRLQSSGAARFESEVLDPVAVTDPCEDNCASTPHDDRSLQPYVMHNAARLEALGDDAVLAIRTGRNAVVAYRFGYTTARYNQMWRTLVEPGTAIAGRFLSSGTHDTIGQLEQHFRVLLDVHASGTLAVAVAGGSYINTFENHADYFHEPVDAVEGFLVTRLNADGRRLGTTVVNTTQLAEVRGLRATQTGFALTGRVRTERRADGTGWDAFAALIAANGGLLQYRAVDVDRGDVLFDIVPLSSGEFLAAGTTGYTQNPSGASISEEAAPLLVILDAGARVSRIVAVPASARHNGVRSLCAYNTGWLAGGMQNGPGTHSYDTAPTTITTDGFLRMVEGVTQ